MTQLRRASTTRPRDEAFTFLTFDGALDGDVPREQTVSYAELDARALSVAGELLDTRATGERVLLLYPPGIDYIVALLGCLYAGAIAVPTYPPYDAVTADRVGRIALDARPAVVLTDAGFAALAGAAPFAAGARWLCTDGLSPRPDLQIAPIAAEATALLQYTSGSTRHPRGVRLTHGNLSANSTAIRTLFALSPGDRGMIWLPPYHDMGLIGGVLQPLHWGFPCVLMSPLDFLHRPLRWLQAITRYGATATGGPDFAYSLCAARVTDDEVDGLDLAGLRLAFLGAEPIRPATLDAFAVRFGRVGLRRTAFYPCYGLAESTLLVTGGRAGTGARVGHYSAEALERGTAQHVDTGGSGLVVCGTPAPGHEVLVVDAAARRPQPDRHVGEVWVRGPSVGAGYFDNSDPDVFTGQLESAGEQRYLRTGDLGFFDGGDLVITGRLDDVLIVHGRNLYPQDLEATAERAHPGLRIGCVAAFLQGDGTPVIVQEVSRSALDPPLIAMAAAIHRAVAAEHRVRLGAVALVAPDAVPKTSSGKVQRRRCRALLAQDKLPVLLLHTDAVAPDAPARTAAGDDRRRRRDHPTGPALRDYVFAELARHCSGADVDPGLSIVQHGLDSLGATNLANAIENDLGLYIAPEELLRDITPATLVRLLDERLSAEPGEELAAEPPPRRLPRQWRPQSGGVEPHP